MPTRQVDHCVEVPHVEISPEGAAATNGLPATAAATSEAEERLRSMEKELEKSAARMKEGEAERQSQAAELEAREAELQERQARWEAQ
eukprot:4580951-Amphidinium_carterae.1